MNINELIKGTMMTVAPKPDLILNKVIQIVHCFLLIVFLMPNVQANELDAKIEAAFAKGQLNGLHAVYVVHKGNVVAESYFSGQDEKWGNSIGNREFDASSLHDLRSVTKSIVGLLYGIALSEELVPEPENILVDQFPQYDDLVKDSSRRKITIHHALSMMMGIQWDESLPYTNVNNSEIAMERAADRYRYALDRPIVEEPGENWVYNGGATALIAGIIAQGASKPIDKFAEEKLFSPLGITDYEWVQGTDGVPVAASGLRMNASDLAKIGLMLNNNGIHENTQVVPVSWIKRSFTANTYDAFGGVGYGYFWLLAPADDPAKWVEASGNGGQTLGFVQNSEFVVVTFAGNYNQPEAWRLPVKIFTDIISPTLFPE